MHQFPTYLPTDIITSTRGQLKQRLSHPMYLPTDTALMPQCPTHLPTDIALMLQLPTNLHTVIITSTRGQLTLKQRLSHPTHLPTDTALMHQFPTCLPILLAISPVAIKAVGKCTT